MDKDEIFKKIQKCLENVPVILIGTGGTIPLGIPGMQELSEHLIHQLADKYKTDTAWQLIVEKLKSGIDLENALTDIPIANSLANDIIIETWNLIVLADIQVFNKTMLGKETMPLSELIHKFYQVHPKCVNIITTNYDRVIEYACDQKRIPYDTRFQGGYLKHYSTKPVGKKEIVNLFKVHGSLDLFKDENNFDCSIPGQCDKPPNGFLPKIITPGTSKYKAVLTGSFRSILHEADTVINEASSFLCIGYGFNDEQIQERIIARIRAGKPIVVVTKAISDKAIRLLKDNSSNFIVIEENPDKPNMTRFTINKEHQDLAGNYWTIDGFLDIIMNRRKI